MTILNIQNRDGNSATVKSTNGNDNSVRGKRPQFLYQTYGKGVPRHEDIVTAKMLMDTAPVSIMVDTILTNITTTEWTITPKTEDPSEEEQRAAEELEKWLQGNFNQNDETFDHLLKKIVKDILAIDAGVVELVPNSEGLLEEMYVRDGATFVKNPDRFDRLPPAPEPAYYQFPLSTKTQGLKRGKSMGEIADELSATKYLYSSAQKEEIPFSRDELVWFEQNPRTHTPYGLGKVQKVKTQVETVLNANLHNNKFFSDNQYSEGALWIDGNKKQIENFRDYWEDEIEGNPHKLPIVGGSDAEWQSFTPAPKDLQFIESQEFYIKFVAMVFGLNQHEIGDIADINRATAKEQKSTVWRKTLLPMMDSIAARFNSEILPWREEYQRVDTELEFEWVIDKPELERMEVQTQKEKLEANMITLNEARDEIGLDPLPWGDMPHEAIRAVARDQPEWFAEQQGMDEEDLPDTDDPFGAFQSTNPEQTDQGTSEDGGKDKKKVPNIITSWEQAFKHPKTVLESTKEAVRNERSNDFPPLAAEEEEMTDEVGKEFLNVKDDLEEAFDEVVDEQDSYTKQELQTKFTRSLEQVIDGLNIADALSGILVQFGMDAMEKSAEHDEGKVRQQLREAAEGEDFDIEIDFDVTDTHAAEQLEQQLLNDSSVIEETMKDTLKEQVFRGFDEGKNPRDVADDILDRVDDMSQHHARTIARTELLSASRNGSQALAESTDVIEEKEWIATSDGREREWHGEMKGVQVDKHDSFVVPDLGLSHQPSDYPRTTKEVGGDQPFNCRCAHGHVTTDLGDDVRNFNQYKNVDVDLQISERQYEVFLEHSKDDEESFEETWKRLNEEMSVSELGRKVVSKPTVYSWNEKLGI